MCRDRFGFRWLCRPQVEGPRYDQRVRDLYECALSEPRCDHQDQSFRICLTDRVSFITWVSRVLEWRIILSNMQVDSLLYVRLPASVGDDINTSGAERATSSMAELFID